MSLGVDSLFRINSSFIHFHLSPFSPFLRTYTHSSLYSSPHSSSSLSLSISYLINFPAEDFDFYSKRHVGMPFGLSIYMDGLVDLRVSTCCEYRHKCGNLLGSRCSHFKLVSMSGGRPCCKYVGNLSRL